MLYDAVTIIGIPVVRALCGWVENAFRDGKIDVPEYKKLGETILRTGAPAVVLYYGFNLDINMAIAAPIIVDYAYAYIKKLIEKTKGK